MQSSVKRFIVVFLFLGVVVGCSKGSGPVLPVDNKPVENNTSSGRTSVNAQSPFTLACSKRFEFVPSKGFAVLPDREAAQDPYPLGEVPISMTVPVFLSYEVESRDGLVSGIITFDLGIQINSGFVPEIMNPAVVFRFNDGENRLRHYLLDKDFYVPSNLMMPISDTNLPLQAAFVMEDPNTGEPIPGPFPDGVFFWHRYQVKVYPEREDEAGQAYIVDNYPVHTWDISVVYLDQSIIPDPDPSGCNKIPLDILNQTIDGAFSSDNFASVFFNVASINYLPGLPSYIASNCLMQGSLFYCDYFETGTVHFKTFDDSIFTTLSPTDEPFLGPGLRADTIQNPDTLLNPGVHHLMVEAIVNYEVDVGEDLYYCIYDDIEVEISPEGDLDGYYDVFYLSSDNSDNHGFYRSRVVVPGSSKSVTDYSTPLGNEFIPTVDEVVSISCSPDGRIVVVGTKPSGICGNGPCYSIQVWDMGLPVPGTFQQPSLLVSDMGNYELKAQNWFEPDDFADADDDSFISEMNPQVSPYDLVHNCYYIVFEGLIRVKEAGIPLDYKRVFWSRIEPGGFFSTPVELRWPFINSLLDASTGTPENRRAYNTSQPSIGGPRELTFGEWNGSGLVESINSSFVISFTSTLSFNDSITLEDLNSLPANLNAADDIAFDKGEAHINFAFLIATGLGLEPMIYYGNYWDESNTGPGNSIIEIEHHGYACYSSQVSSDGRILAYLGGYGSYSLPYTNLIAHDGPEIEDFDNSLIAETIAIVQEPEIFYLILHCTRRENIDMGLSNDATKLPSDFASNLSRNYFLPKTSNFFDVDLEDSGPVDERAKYFTGVFRQDYGLLSDIDVCIYGKTLGQWSLDPPGESSTIHYEYSSLDVACNISYGHDDWPFMSGDGTAVVYSTQAFTGGDIIFVHLEHDVENLELFILPANPGAGKPLPYLGGEHDCIRVSENGTNTYPVCTSFISNQ